MIRIEKDYGRVPAKLTGKGIEKTNELIQAFENGETKFDFDSKIYGHKTVKDELKRIQHNKCCFCEAKVSHVAHGDVEHFRPKKAYKADDGDPLTYPGYYWLAYDFSNLFFACQKCNQTYKKNYFPVRDERKRARSHNDIVSDESPLLIHPEHDEPGEYLRFAREFIVAKEGNRKGEETIKRTGLNRFALEEERRQYLRLMGTVAKLASLSSASQADREEARQLMENACSVAGKFSLMIRHNFPEFIAE
jgi:uncharacterized protein (TIGR02646 family)